MDQTVSRRVVPAPPRRMGRAEYRAWTELQPRGRWERVDGEVIAMNAERVGHVRLKFRVVQALQRAIRSAGVPCEALGDGITIEVGDDADYEPDAVVNCGPRLHPDAIAATNPMVVVEVTSPSTQSTDTGHKLGEYFQVPSIHHYLIVRTRRRDVIHHARLEDRIETRIVAAGAIALDPPGIMIDCADLFEDVPE